MRLSAFFTMLMVFGIAVCSPSDVVSVSLGQEWPNVELDRAPTLREKPVIRGQNFGSSPPVVYFDQDPSVAIMPAPDGMQGSQTMGYSGMNNVGMPGPAGYAPQNGYMLPHCMGSSQYIGVFGEFLYLNPRNADVAFGIPQDGVNPVGAVGIADIGYTPAFRAGGFFTMGEDALVELTYSRFDASSTTNISTAAPNVINPLVLFPGTFNAGFTAEAASADYGINFQFIDADYMVMACNCEQYWLGYLLGARYAELGQNFTATFPFAPPDGTTTLNTDIDFTGVGMRVGITGERLLFPRGGLRLYGNAIANFLVGKFDASYTQRNQFNGLEASATLSEDRIVPVLDLELGIAWLGPKGHFRVSAGYMVSAWFNAVTTPDWIESVQNGSYSPGSSTLTFDGLTARAQLAF
jgi:hypothetical protein